FVVDGADGISSSTNNGDGFVLITYDEDADACDPPAFSQAFTPASILTGQTATLSFTIDSSAVVVDTTNLAFTNTLAPGLVVAPVPAAGTTCGGTVTADAGASTISFSDGALLAGQSCVVSVDVVSSTPGALVSTSGDLTTSLGNSGDSTATLTVSEPNTTTSLTSATDSGTIMVMMSGPPGCTLDEVDAVTAESLSPELPEGVEFPHGLVGLRIEGCAAGATVDLT